MRPIAIFRHVPHEGPGYLAEFLDRQGVPWTLIAIDRQDALPVSPEAYAGLAFMGGPMSVNDDLPWIAQSLSLIQQAVATGIPVIGHCLGGQLMARALGAQVTANPHKEIGWGRVWCDAAEASADWLGETGEFTAFHWHGETFDLPEGATRLLASALCVNQAFVLGPHLAMQCHVEMTAPMVAEWCRVGADEMAAAQGPGVQDAASIEAQAADYLPSLQVVAERLYSKWLAGVSRA